MRRCRFLVTAVAAAAVVAGCHRGLVYRPAPPEGGEWLVHFIASEIGDATLLRVGERNLLIDGAEHASWLHAYLDSVGVERLDLVVVTHPDKDHWHGLVKVLEEGRIEIGAVWLPRFENTLHCRASHSFRALERTVERLSASRGFALERDDFRVGTRRAPWDDANLAVTVLHATATPESDIGWWMRCPYLLNNGSLVMLVEIDGRWKFLFTGDANGKPKSATGQRAGEVEGALLRRYDTLSAHVLKVPHHGSETASTIPFIEAVLRGGGLGPRYAVIHPNRWGIGSRLRLGLPKRTVVERYEALDSVTTLSAQFGHVYCGVDRGELSCTTASERNR